MTVTQIAILITLAGVALLWYRSREMRRYAFQIAARYCQQHQLKLLDDSVSFNRIWLIFKPRFVLGRCYSFEFTADTAHRHKGWVIFHGLKSQIETEAYYLPEPRD